MKVKGDFITNSSSASYILTLKTQENNTLEEFKEKFNKYIEKYQDWHEVHLRYWNAADIKQVGENEFTVEDWTSMHNDAMDIPGWMQNLMLQHFVKEEKYDWWVSSFKVDNDY